MRASRGLSKNLTKSKMSKDTSLSCLRLHVNISQISLE